MTADPSRGNHARTRPRDICYGDDRIAVVRYRQSALKGAQVEAAAGEPRCRDLSQASALVINYIVPTAYSLA